MEKQLIIDTFNTDRDYLINVILKRHNDGCKLAPKAFVAEVMKALISEDGIKVIEAEAAEFNTFDADIIAIALDAIATKVNSANQSEAWSQEMVEAAKQRQRNAYKGSWAKVNDPAPAWSK
jgi:hypothetical protein